MTMLSDDLKAARGLYAATPSLGLVRAIERVAGMSTLEARACIKAIRDVGGPSDTDWSDRKAVLSRVDRAIAAAEHQEQGE